MADRGVHGSPYQGVEGLIQWALDMWPALNGRCLMSGVDLRELDAAAALDVMFHLFELDTIDHPETLSARSHVRVQVWPLWFDREYRYPRQTADEPYAQTTYGSQDMMDLPEDSGQSQGKRAVMPFVPASTPAELAQVLDGPLGGD